MANSFQCGSPFVVLKQMKNKIMGGYFMLARQIFESKIWVNKPSSWKVIWIYIIGQVNHKEKSGFKRGEGFFQMKREIKDIGSDITPDIIKKCILFLKQNGMISTERSTRGMTIKVLNFGKYQEPDNYTSTDQSTKKALRKHLESTPINKNDKNDKNEKIINIPFSTFWNLYDYKKSKPIAEKKWDSLTDEEREKVIEALPDYIASTNKNGKYPPRKYPTTYLNQEGWEDEMIKGKGIIDYDEMGLT